MCLVRMLPMIVMCLVASCVTSRVGVAQKWQQSQAAYTSAKPTQNPISDGYKLSPPLLARLVDAATLAKTNIEPRDINFELPLYVYAYDVNGKKVGFLRTTGNGIDLCFEMPGLRPYDTPIVAVVRDASLVRMLVNELAKQKGNVGHSSKHQRTSQIRWALLPVDQRVLPSPALKDHGWH